MDLDRYPGNDGATPGTRIRCTEAKAAIDCYGLDVDRIGDPDGSRMWFFVDGRPAWFEERSLPVSSLAKHYYKYQLTGLLPPGWSIEVSEVAPAFGRPGGATQLRFFDHDDITVAIGKLLDVGALVPHE